MIYQHAEQSGFPANRISEVKGVIDPTTAETNSHLAETGLCQMFQEYTQRNPEHRTP